MLFQQLFFNIGNLLTVIQFWSPIGFSSINSKYCWNWKTQIRTIGLKEFRTSILWIFMHLLGFFPSDLIYFFVFLANSAPNSIPYCQGCHGTGWHHRRWNHLQRSDHRWAAEASGPLCVRGKVVWKSTFH